MSLSIPARTWEKKEVTLSIDREPDYCPLCNKHLSPIFVTAYTPYHERCEIVYRCPSQKCQSFFIAYHSCSDIIRDRVFHLHRIRPVNLQGINFDPEIKQVSPNFCEIYQEASFCEARDYKQVAGAGYRKALEYLIKDFCIAKNPKKTEDIKNIFLGHCINTYIDDVTSVRLRNE